jgi:hypothetical protein
VWPGLQASLDVKRNFDNKKMTGYFFLQLRLSKKKIKETTRTEKETNSSVK